MATIHVPVFEKDGNRLFVRTEDFIGEDEHNAREIGWGAMLVECILLGMNFTGDVISFDSSKGIEHRKARLGGYPVAVISGPLFDEAKEKI